MYVPLNVQILHLSPYFNSSLLRILHVPFLPLLFLPILPIHIPIVCCMFRFFLCSSCLSFPSTYRSSVACSVSSFALPAYPSHPHTDRLLHVPFLPLLFLPILPIHIPIACCMFRFFLCSSCLSFPSTYRSLTQ